MSLEVQQLSVKLYATPSADYEPGLAIRAFHRWIQEDTLDELMIDVTDYSHVPDGPGVLLLCDGAQYGLDEAGGRVGLQYRRKRDEPGPVAAKLRDALGRLLFAADLLTKDPAVANKLVIRTDELRVQVHSRLLAPNTDATLDASRTAIAAALEGVYGAPPQLSRLGDERELFQVHACIQDAPGLEVLVERARAAR